MKKLLFSILAVAGISLSATSCWDENIPEAGAARHQVTDLKAVPGDEEAQLSWSMPEGWNPTEYLITYTDGDKISLRTSERVTRSPDLPMVKPTHLKSRLYMATSFQAR